MTVSKDEGGPAGKGLVLETLTRLVIVLLKEEAIAHAARGDGLDKVSAQRGVGLAHQCVCLLVRVLVQGRQREVQATGAASRRSQPSSSCQLLRATGEGLET